VFSTNVNSQCTGTRKNYSSPWSYCSKELKIRGHTYHNTISGQASNIGINVFIPQPKITGVLVTINSDTKYDWIIYKVHIFNIGGENSLSA
jgi:hypothetical protein